MAEFQVNGIIYRSTTLPLMDQHLLATRFAPVIGKLASFLTAEDFKRFSPKEEGEDGRNISSLAFLAPITEAIGMMSDKDNAYVIGKCMSVVQRNRGGDSGFAPVWNEAASRPMFDDIDLISMYQIVYHVLIDILGPFGRALSSTFSR